MSLSQSRNSHERNLEKSLETQAQRAPGHGPAGAPGTSRTGGDADPATGDADPDVASRLAREAAEREAVRRASERTEGAPKP